MTKPGVFGLTIVSLLLIAFLVSCGSPRPLTDEPGDAARGRVIFQQPSIHGSSNCSACHSLEPGVTVVGPSLAHLGERAAALLKSTSYKGLARTPEELLREAILTGDCKLWGDGNRHAIIPEGEGVFDHQ